MTDENLEHEKLSNSFAGFFTQKTSDRYLSNQASTISAVLKTDIQALVEVAEKTRAETYPNSPQNILQHAYFEGRLCDPNCIIFVAKENDKIVGFVDAELNVRKNSVLLNQLYVLKDYQSNGYGTRLIQNCFLYALKSKINRAELFVFDDNLKVKTFFQKKGFVVAKSGIPGYGVSMKCDDIEKFTPYVPKVPKVPSHKARL